jgi:hypothetical protein
VRAFAGEGFNFPFGGTGDIADEGRELPFIVFGSLPSVGAVCGEAVEAGEAGAG